MSSFLNLTCVVISENFYFYFNGSCVYMSMHAHIWKLYSKRRQVTKAREEVLFKLHRTKIKTRFKLFSPLTLFARHQNFKNFFYLKIIRENLPRLREWRRKSCCIAFIGVNLDSPRTFRRLRMWNGQNKTPEFP